jgi:uncharacterized protein with von Willebrand factor type A (vWA) domain
MWNNLPDFFNGKFEESLVVADVSGSMDGIPMAVSISLAMYIAERNKSVFNNKFITFSGNPKLQTITGKTLYEKVINLLQADWGTNTDLIKTFDLILNKIEENQKLEDLKELISSKI